jgi:hypothetical protein
MSRARATGEAAQGRRVAWPRWWPAALAWALWVLVLAALAAVPWLDGLLRRAGRPDLVPFTPGVALPTLAMVSGATVGAVLASRRPRHPVGWLLLALALSLAAIAAAAQYLIWGLLVRPGAWPFARSVALHYSATGHTGPAGAGGRAGRRAAGPALRSPGRPLRPPRSWPWSTRPCSPRKRRSGCG